MADAVATTDETGIRLDDFLKQKRQRRAAVFADAATASVLMVGVPFMSRHAYHVFDFYCGLYMSFRLRHRPTATAMELEQIHDEAADTFHALWVVVALLAYTAGWFLTELDGDSTRDWLLWMIPLTICTYRMFLIGTVLIEIYFRDSEARHHQFRILLHAFLHYLVVAFSFALFYVFIDWAWNTFSTVGDDGEIAYDFNEWIDPIYHSMLTVMAFSPNYEPQTVIGKVLILIEVCIGFALATFIFLNITQLWIGKRE
jgi:hypothetical protein